MNVDFKCRCFCPSCNDPFKARMGDVRAHHFAHSGEGCDEEIAFLRGLYKLVQEYVLENLITLPTLKVYWQYSDSRFTEQNFLDRVFYRKDSGAWNETVVYDEKAIRLETAKISFNGKRPIALLSNKRQFMILLDNDGFSVENARKLSLLKTLVTMTMEVLIRLILVFAKPAQNLLTNR